jgi:phosphoribosylglycinamide formyltransferase-1
MSAPPPLPIAVLVSGRGSNLRALVEAIEAGRCHARVVGVAADREKGCDALAFAAAHALPTRVVRPKEHPDRESWDRALTEAVAGWAPELVVLAGFMRIVRAAFLARFGGRTVNVHPSLLPAFPGLDAPGQAVAAGVRISGCTVHLVDAGVDTGPILAQAAVPVLPDDDAAALHARIQPVEHRLLPRVVDWIARGHLELGPPPRFTGQAHPAPPLYSPTG